MTNMAHPGHPKYATEWVTLAGWMTVEEAAKTLGRSGARVRQMIGQQNFPTVALLGDKPIYLLREEDVRTLAENLPL